MTKETFDKLSDKIVNMDKDVELIQTIIKLIFDKALLEPKFSDMYAQLCLKLSIQNADYGVGPDGKPMVCLLTSSLLIASRSID